MTASTRIARQTGSLYLGLAVAGGLSFLVVKPRLFAPGHPQTTLANLVANPQLARIGVALELVTVVTQALAALWFQRLFRSVDRSSALAIAAFGLVNAIVILGSAAMIATAGEISQEPFGDAASTVHVLYLISGTLWSIGGLFFGLWLIPMGRCVLASGSMPRPLGWILISGGGCYILGAIAGQLFPAWTALDTIQGLLATVGEVWMIGYLLMRGFRPQASAPVAPLERPSLAAHPR